MQTIGWSLNIVSMNPEEKRALSTAIHMLRCNISTARFGIVSNKTDMVVSAANEMDKTLSELERELEHIEAHAVRRSLSKSKLRHYPQGRRLDGTHK